jgi:hypothetical protein
MAQKTKHTQANENISDIEELNELALDMLWPWSHASNRLCGRINPELWELTRNPQAVLQSKSGCELFGG